MLTLLACAQIVGAAPLLEPGAMVLVGEMHGSREIPQAIETLACMARARKVPVTVALEMPLEDDPAFWTRDYQDGRSSAAMSHLAHSGFPVVRYDTHPADPQARDRQMAEQLIALREKRPGDLILVLSGNIHNRITIGVPWNPDFRPMGWHLVQHGVRLVSLEVTYDGGQTWMCDEKNVCGPHDLKATGSGGAPAIAIKAQPDRVHGTLFVGALSASPPASREAR